MGDVRTTSANEWKWDTLGVLIHEAQCSPQAKEHLFTEVLAIETQHLTWRRVVVVQWWPVSLTKPSTGSTMSLLPVPLRSDMLPTDAHADAAHLSFQAERVHAATTGFAVFTTLA